MNHTYEYRIANAAELERIWEQNISDHSGDPRWGAWSQEAQINSALGRSVVFAVFVDGMPVGEGTLLLDPRCSAIGGRLALCDGCTRANVNALRVQKAYEGRGHISRLMREMQRFAAEKGIEVLTIGVEEKEMRNRSIYEHWGFTHFLFSCTEDGEKVLYYGKAL